MSKRKIFFYASLPREGHPPYGGGEVGNLRTLKMLRKAGYEVKTIRHRRSDAKWGKRRRLFSHPFRLLAGWAETFFKLMFAPRKSIVHLSGCAGVTILNEYVLMHIMRGLGFRVIYEIRGGGIVGFWDNGSTHYKYMFNYLLNSACCVFSQGKENFPLFHSITNTEVYHYPNCVENSFAPNVYMDKDEDHVDLLFYGRLEEDKHVDIVVETAALVQKKYSNVKLTIVGSGRRDYVKRIKEEMNSKLIQGSFVYESARNHDNLKELLIHSHFYIFPSTQPREGQSNSITECMSYGIIPIASPQGFNRSTIGNDELIIEKLDARLYANKIIEIIEGGRLKKISRQMYDRYLEYYSEEVVTRRTLETYSSIIEQIRR